MSEALNFVRNSGKFTVAGGSLGERWSSDLHFTQFSAVNHIKSDTGIPGFSIDNYNGHSTKIY